MRKRKILAILLTVISILSLCTAGCGNNGGTNAGKVEDDFGTVLRFVVTSDTHISSVGDETAQRFTKLFKSAYAYAEKQAYDKLDAIVVAGDMTNYGQPYELQAWKSIVDKNVKDGTEVITVMGNHEYYAYLKDLPAGVESYTNNLDKELNKHGIEVFYPDEEGQIRLMEIIYDQIKAGKEINTGIFESYLREMKQRGVEAFILGCTELPMAFSQGDYGCCFIDSLDILAKRTVEKAGFQIKIVGDK